MRHGVLSASYGPGKGYALARPATAITLRQILEVVEGPALLAHCLLWTGHTDAAPCLLHGYVQPILDQLAERLEAVTLAEFAVVGSSPDAAPTAPGALTGIGGDPS